jgi:hypothetical protein
VHCSHRCSCTLVRQTDTRQRRENLEMNSRFRAVLYEGERRSPTAPIFLRCGSTAECACVVQADRRIAMTWQAGWRFQMETYAEQDTHEWVTRSSVPRPGEGSVIGWGLSARRNYPSDLGHGRTWCYGVAVVSRLVPAR